MSDQVQFVAAEQPQLLQQWIQRRQGAPAVSIGAESIGQTPRIEAIGFVAGGDFPLTIGVRRTRIDWINRAAALEQLIDGGSLVGLDRDG